FAGAADDYSVAYRGGVDDYAFAFTLVALRCLAGRQDEARRLNLDRIALEKRFERGQSLYLIARQSMLGHDLGGDPGGAARMLKSAGEKGQDGHWVPHTLGLIHCRAGRLEEAILAFKQSLAQDTAASAAVNNWLGLALAYQGLGKTDEARQWYQR